MPSRHRFCVYLKHSGLSPVFAISAMGVRGGILLKAWILMGFLSESTGPARITPPLYCNGFSSDWTFAYSKALSWAEVESEGGLQFFCCQHFFGQCLHKGSAICLLSRSLVSGREQWDIFHVACYQLGPQYSVSVVVCLMFQNQQKIISLIILPPSTLC